MTTNTNKNFKVIPGERFHCLTAVSLPIGSNADSAGEVVARGRTVVVTERLVEATKNKHGVTWLDLVGDADAQLARWGEVRFAPGPWPEDTEVWEQGDPVWELSRAKAQASAWAVEDETERAEALRAVLVRYGRGLPTSTETGKYDGGRSTTDTVSPTVAPRRGGLYA